jgi:hypothetical protein
MPLCSLELGAEYPLHSLHSLSFPTPRSLSLSPRGRTPPWQPPSGAPRHRRYSSNSKLLGIPQQAPPPSQLHAPPCTHACPSSRALERATAMADRPNSRGVGALVPPCSYHLGHRHSRRAPPVASPCDAELVALLPGLSSPRYRVATGVRPAMDVVHAAGRSRCISGRDSTPHGCG